MVSFENCAHTWKILATLLIETLLKTRKEKPKDSSKLNHPLVKIDHEVVAAEDELERFWSSAIFQGSPDKILYDGHSLLVVLLTTTLPLLVFRGVLSLRAEIKLQTHLKSHRERTPFLFAISEKHSGRFTTEFSFLFSLFRIRTILSYPFMD